MKVYIVCSAADPADGGGAGVIVEKIFFTVDAAEKYLTTLDQFTRQYSFWEEFEVFA